MDVSENGGTQQLLVFHIESQVWQRLRLGSQQEAGPIRRKLGMYSSGGATFRSESEAYKNKGTPKWMVYNGKSYLNG